MSSMHERSGQHPVNFWSTRENREFVGNAINERLASPEFPNGLWFPLSGVLGDTYRDDGTEFSSKGIFPVMHAAFSSLLDTAERNDVKIKLRGSTWAYKLLNASGTERRGTVSQAVLGAMSPAIERFGYTKSAQALGSLANSSDWDLVLPDVAPSVLPKLNQQLQDELRATIGASNVALFRKSQDSCYPTKKIRYRNKWFRQNSGGMLCVEHDGTVADGKIPYGEVDLKTKNGRMLTNIFWTPGNLEGTEDLVDTRLDPEFSLSWDWAAVGDVSHEVTGSVGMISRVAGDMALFLGTSPQRRHISELGIFPSAEYAEGKDIWFHLPKENMEVLTRPIEVGARFSEVPVLEQFKLAVRACQKGALNEENVAVTVDEAAPALSVSAREAFRNIDVNHFRQEYHSLPDKDKIAFDEDVMRDVMLGLFYPGKFLSYFLASGLNRFFPQLNNISEDEFSGIIGKMPDHDIYSKRQYAATHYTETAAQNGIERQIELTRKYNSLANPYHLLFRTLLEDYPHVTPNVGNSFEAVDILFGLSEHEFEPVNDGDFITMNLQRKRTREEFTEVDMHPKSGNAFDDYVHGQAREIGMEMEITKQQMKIRAAQLAAACLGGIVFLASQEVGYTTKIGMAGEISGAAISLTALTSYFTRRIKEALSFLDEEEREMGLWNHEIEEEDLPKG